MKWRLAETLSCCCSCCCQTNVVELAVHTKTARVTNKIWYLRRPILTLGPTPPWPGVGNIAKTAPATRFTKQLVGNAVYESDSRLSSVINVNRSYGSYSNSAFLACARALTCGCPAECLPECLLGYLPVAAPQAEKARRCRVHCGRLPVRSNVCGIPLPRRLPLF